MFMTKEITTTVWKLQFCNMPDTTKDFTEEMVESFGLMRTEDKTDILATLDELPNPMLNRLNDKLEMLIDELNEKLDCDSKYYQSEWEGTDDEGYHIMSEEYNSFDDINANLKWLKGNVEGQQYYRINQLKLKK